ncbi:MAG TPA: cytochrome ubiquinol oxidase subunit I, partial [Galbitalea sp.]
MSFVLANALTLSRWQFATTTLYHFTFVPLTLGLAPLLAIMQTLYYRTHDEKWNRLVGFFAVLFLINFAIGTATGMVQEFEFGMNWSSFSKYVGDVFGAPLAIEGLGAFMLESTFIGLWVFGRGRLSPRVHLATIYLVWLGTWLSAYFIIVANSWMQHPVGYQINHATGTAQATNISTILFQSFALYAYGHVILAGCLTGGFVMLGVCAWHLRKGRNVEVFRAAAKVAVLVLIPLSALQLWWGNNLGIQTTKVQPMKIAATEALWNTQEPASFSIFQIGGFTRTSPTPSFSIEIPGLLSYLATGSFHGTVVGLNENQRKQTAEHGPGNYTPEIELAYWS